MYTQPGRGRFFVAMNTPPFLLTDTAVFRQLGAAFGLRQAAVGRLLGLSPQMTNNVCAGRKPLPAATYPQLARLLLALDALPPADSPAAPPPNPPAPVPLGRHARACRATAARLQLEEGALRARAAWAARRLAALPALEDALRLAPPDPLREPPDPADPAARPRWLTRFLAEAREALAAAGPDAQARLALRRAALLHEATLAERLLAGEALAAVVPPEAGAL